MDTRIFEIKGLEKIFQKQWSKNIIEGFFGEAGSRGEIKNAKVSDWRLFRHDGSISIDGIVQISRSFAGEN